MRRLLRRARSTLDDVAKSTPRAPQPDGQLAIQAPTLTDVTRYRYHHGVNLGSVFIMERWLTGSMFDQDTHGSSELAAVEGWVKKEGLEATRNRFERHWRQYVSDADLDWLRDVARCTTVRLPIGYFTLGPPYCVQTPFQRVAPVYERAWQAVVDLVRRCHERGMGVVIDVHGLPGGANAQEHSGTNSGKAEFWASRRNRELATRCMCFIAHQARSMPGCAGIQIVNEAEHNAKNMYDWYAEVVKELSSIDYTLPIYISDAWDLHKAATWSQRLNTMDKLGTNPVVVDTHLYWCFDADDVRRSSQHITVEVQKKLHESELRDGRVADRGASQIIVGEYSCVLGEESWAKGGNQPREQQVREFGNAQCQRLQQRAGGSFFWTYRMDWMPGGEWGFKQMTESHAIRSPTSLTLDAGEINTRAETARSQRDQRKGAALDEHCQYWDSKQDETYEHWRYDQGWDVGWDDAVAFFAMRSEHGFHGGDKIGMLDLWLLKRLRESGQRGRFVWEFEQGLRRGVRDLHEAAGV